MLLTLFYLAQQQEPSIFFNSDFNSYHDFFHVFYCYKTSEKRRKEKESYD